MQRSDVSNRPTGFAAQLKQFAALVTVGLTCLALAACHPVRVVEIPTPTDPCRIPEWPDVGAAPLFVDCDGDGPGDLVCVSARDLAHLGAVLESIAAWRDQVLSCPADAVVVGAPASRFHFPGLGVAVRRAGRDLGAL
jgi:hypothetical protein